MDVSILLEVRPRVQACWAYLTAPSSQACAKLIVRPTQMTVTWSEGTEDILSQTVSLPSTIPIKFEPCQLSSLVQEEKHISFRVQTSPKNLTGSFSLELVESNESTSVVREHVLSIPSDEPCSMSCLCCGQNILVKEVITFKRILPLPSSSCDASDFFCHNHGDSSVDINPNETDCLYSSSGFQIHSSHLGMPDSVIRCKSCLAWLGTMSQSRAQLWYTTIEIKSSLSRDIQVPKLLPAQEFIHIIQLAIKQCPTLICQILLNVKVSVNVTHYLLLCVIDRQLTLLTASSSLSKEFVSYQAIKVSFHVEKSRSLMVSKWLTDSFVSCIDVALPVFVQGLKLLSHTAQFIPSSHRKAQHNFLLAYVCDYFVDK